MRLTILTISALLGLSTAVSAGEKNMMHCFAYTTVEGATQEQWDAIPDLPKK